MLASGGHDRCFPWTNQPQFLPGNLFDMGTTFQSFLLLEQQGILLPRFLNPALRSGCLVLNGTQLALNIVKGIQEISKDT